MIRQNQSIPNDQYHVTPPSNLETENAVLGAILSDPSRMDAVLGVIDKEDFYDDRNRTLFDALEMLYAAGNLSSDLKATVPHLRALHILDSQWSHSKLVNLKGMGEPRSARIYADEIRKLADLRRQQQIFLELLRQTESPDADPNAVARCLDSRLASLGMREESSVRLIGDIADEVLLDMQNNTIGRQCLMTGIASIDEHVGGIAPGELCVIGARPGCGKTALAMQIALHNARNARSVLFVSLEMSDRGLIGRQMCSEASVDTRRQRKRTISPDENIRLTMATKNLHDIPLKLWAPAKATTSEIKAKARIESKMAGLSMLVVDYIGLVRPSDTRIQRYEQVGQISRDLKCIAKELDVPILALCQLNREAAKSEPTLAMLRESGDIEQDADIVWLLHLKEGSDSATLKIEKHRHGGTGDVPLRWIPEETRFEEF